MADATQSSASYSACEPNSRAEATIQHSHIEAAPATFLGPEAEDIATDTSVSANDEVSQPPSKVTLSLLTNVNVKAVNLQRYRFGSRQRCVCAPTNSGHLCRLSHIDFRSSLVSYASLSEEAREYVFENGRRYHGYKRGSKVDLMRPYDAAADCLIGYMLPNDEVLIYPQMIYSLNLNAC
jgi:hypothetical protein